MRYTHNIKIVHKKGQALKISLVFTIFLLLLILYLGFTTLNAQEFFVGFFASLMRVLTAYVFSLIIAASLALVVTSSEKIESIGLPLLDALQSFPSFAI
ncbi:hypothetical protein HY030_01435, partial [Candidatus Gottesmanbacteria bacterium]|nr:hypothetical protein [Candidatus Gottesmanbacteria bacterium]